MKAIIKLTAHIRAAGAICSVVLLLFIGLADMAMAGPNCNKNPDHPKCVPEPPPDPGGPADPKVAYLIDGQIYLSNADGSVMTLVRSETDGDRPRLYAGPTGGKVLFYKTLGLGQEEYLAYRSYSLVNGEVVADTQDQVLVWDSQLDEAFLGGGNFTGFGLNDWSPDGTGYAYSFYQSTANGAIYRIMYAPSLLTPFIEHVIVREGLPGGGQNSAQWDASGDFLYMTEDNNDGPVHDLLVIGVTTNPGVVVATVPITNLLTATGFPASSNGGASEAGAITGSATELTSCDPGHCYSFDPGSLPARWDTSVCLLTGWVDWDSRNDTRFAIILDLPSIFDSDAQVSCPFATPAGTAILDFNAWEFTTNDEGIVGENKDQSGRKKRGNPGTWIYDLRLGTEGTRTKISDEGAADWAN